MNEERDEWFFQYIYFWNTKRNLFFRNHLIKLDKIEVKMDLSPMCSYFAKGDESMFRFNPWYKNYDFIKIAYLDLNLIVI